MNASDDATTADSRGDSAMTRGDFPEVSVDHRVRGGHRAKRLYHDPCDDERAHGDGHMQVVKSGVSWVYRCRTCGHEVPYDEFDTAMSPSGWR